MDLDEIRIAWKTPIPRMRMEQITIDGVRFRQRLLQRERGVDESGAADDPRDTGRGPKGRRVGECWSSANGRVRAHCDIGAMAANCGLAMLVTVGQSAD